MSSGGNGMRYFFSYVCLFDVAPVEFYLLLEIRISVLENPGAGIHLTRGLISLCSDPKMSGGRTPLRCGKWFLCLLRLWKINLELVRLVRLIRLVTECNSPIKS